MSALPPKADIEGQTRDCAGFILETGIAVKGRPSGHRAERFQTVCRELFRRFDLNRREASRSESSPSLK